MTTAFLALVMTGLIALAILINFSILAKFYMGGDSKKMVFCQVPLVIFEGSCDICTYDGIGNFCEKTYRITHEEAKILITGDKP